ncbi:arabinan endo-1,5-alpha-L-arabinosidase [Pseudarcicella hirudinis]|uniref:Arabinan endo-1,5-alpha-L-arabinosidase n=2 Tax=Pseudarcicella hirudinis TaxID=1079859 RepID=A0A1I5TXT3_9BACT|nr:arabinan endo-1,5-alpha-L-arabinosidase [Pseudarcicella hirudinis]
MFLISLPNVKTSEGLMLLFSMKTQLQRLWLISGILLFFFCQEKPLFAQQGDTYAHDPSTIQHDGKNYWIFSTGQGIKIDVSSDLNVWKTAKQTVFAKDSFPSWIKEYVPGFKGHFWAPDCIFMNKKYYLYYSCSTFGSSQSVIGLATNPSLNPESPDYKWTDEGMVVSSGERKDMNAIDPGLLKDTQGKIYLTYGSFFGGIGAVELDSVSGKIKSRQVIQKVAGGRESDWEASCMIQEGRYYYLFVNNGLCCKGVNSTYYIVAGRSENPTGPFLDKSGKDLNAGGGTVLLRTEGKYIGPGHVGLLREKNRKIVSIHFYDAEDEGKSKFEFIKIGFKNNWPYLKR